MGWDLGSAIRLRRIGAELPDRKDYLLAQRNNGQWLRMCVWGKRGWPCTDAPDALALPNLNYRTRRQ
jgi:hypothetical protein